MIIREYSDNQFRGVGYTESFKTSNEGNPHCLACDALTYGSMASI